MSIEHDVQQQIAKHGDFGRHYDQTPQVPISNNKPKSHVPSAIDPSMKLKIPTLVLLLRTMNTSPYYSDLKHKTGRPGFERGSPEFWYHLIVGVFLVLAGGVFAGYVFYAKNKAEIF